MKSPFMNWKYFISWFLLGKPKIQSAIESSPQMSRWVNATSALGWLRSGDSIESSDDLSATEHDKVLEKEKDGQRVSESGQSPTVKMSNQRWIELKRRTVKVMQSQF